MKSQIEIRDWETTMFKRFLLTLVCAAALGASGLATSQYANAYWGSRGYYYYPAPRAYNFGPGYGYGTYYRGYYGPGYYGTSRYYGGPRYYGGRRYYYGSPRVSVGIW